MRTSLAGPQRLPCAVANCLSLASLTLERYVGQHGKCSLPPGQQSWSFEAASDGEMSPASDGPAVTLLTATPISDLLQGTLRTRRKATISSRQPTLQVIRPIEAKARRISYLHRGIAISFPSPHVHHATGAKASVCLIAPTHPFSSSLFLLLAISSEVLANVVGCPRPARSSGNPAPGWRSHTPSSSLKYPANYSRHGW